MKKGNRKFVAFVIAMACFTALALIIDDVDFVALGSAITMIAAAFFTGNAIEHYSETLQKRAG